MGDLVPLRGATIELDAKLAGEAFVGAMTGAVDRYLDGIDAQFQKDGIPPWKVARVRVVMTDQLMAALSAPGAFQLAVSFDGKEESTVTA
jgi:hypothetical protein